MDIPSIKTGQPTTYILFTMSHTCQADAEHARHLLQHGDGKEGRARLGDAGQAYGGGVKDGELCQVVAIAAAALADRVVQAHSGGHILGRGWG